MNRRGLLLGVGAFLAAPSIVRASSLMPVSLRVPLKRVWNFRVQAEGIDDGWRFYQTLSGLFEDQHQAIAAMRLPVQVDVTGWQRTTGPFWVPVGRQIKIDIPA